MAYTASCPDNWTSGSNLTRGRSLDRGRRRELAALSSGSGVTVLDVVVVVSEDEGADMTSPFGPMTIRLERPGRGALFMVVLK